MIGRDGTVVARVPLEDARATPAASSSVLPFDLTLFRSSGLLYVANRAIHPFGVAIAANMEDGKVTSLSVIETRDPLGFTYPDEAENDARRRLFKWLRSRLS